MTCLGLEQIAHANGPDPAAEAQRLIAKLDAAETRELVKDPVSRAKAAQQRAQSARGAGDLLHATELDALALTWAQVADDLVRTAASEKKLAELQKSVAELEQKAVRTQALIEQTIARRGRAEQNSKVEPSVAVPAGSKGEPTKASLTGKPGKAQTPAPAPAKAAQPAVKQ